VQKKTPKILLITHLPPPVHGAAAMGDLLAKSKVIKFNFRVKFLNLSTSASINEIGAYSIQKLGKYVKLFLSVLIYGLFWRPKLVYVTPSAKSLGLLKDGVLIIICKILGLRVVLHFHNKGIKSLQNKFYSGALKYAVFNKTKVILLSPLLYNEFSHFVESKNVFYCENGISGAEFKRVEHKQYQISGKIKLLFFSNLIKSKGILDLLNACSILKKKEILFECQIAGSPGDLSEYELKEILELLHLTNEVHYLGKLYGDEKISLFNKSDLLILPTKEDCFPLVILEAMESSLPIISTNEGAIIEIISDNIEGFIVAKDSPESIAEKIELYSKNVSLLETHGKSARLKFESRFTQNLFEQRWINIINQILSKK
jgi:glycosyltransferase involved in cell wall biosynthesis